MNTEFENISRPFESHPGVTEFHFTSDLQSFFKDHDATAHQIALRRRGENGEVKTITREQWKEMKAIEDSPVATTTEPVAADPAVKQLTAQEAFDKATADLDAANKAKTELPDTATGVEKGNATKAVNKALAALAEAQVALDAAQA